MTLQWSILEGDAARVMASMPAGLARCCVTSPPYWRQRDYGVDGQIGLEETPWEWAETIVRIFREVRRILTGDGTLWIVVGDAHASASRRPCGPSRKCVHRGGVERRPAPGCKAKDLVGLPWMLASALRDDGWHLRSIIIWHKPNAMPESVRDRPSHCYEHVLLLARSSRYYFDCSAIAEPRRTLDNRPPNGRADTGQRPHAGRRGVGAPRAADPSVRLPRNLWSIPAGCDGAARDHPARFPAELARRCIAAGSAPGDTVLDPFCGSGTTIGAAILSGRSAVGVELSRRYAMAAREAVDAMAPLLVDRAGRRAV